MKDHDLQPVVGPRIQAVVFDLDDTLFDHRESARRGVVRFVEELGARAGPEIIESVESTAERLMACRRVGEIDRAEYQRLRIRKLLADLGRADEAERLDGPHCDRLYARFLDAYEAEWIAFADARPTLRALRDRQIPVAILTNGPEGRQQRKARDLGLAASVVGVWTSERLAARKPERAPYLTVCQALGKDPGDVLHVGDNAEHDLHGALAAGLQALHLDRRRELPATAQRIAGLDEVVSRL